MYFDYSKNNPEKVNNFKKQLLTVKFFLSQLNKTEGNKNFQSKQFEKAETNYMDGIIIFRYWDQKTGFYNTEKNIKIKSSPSKKDITELLKTLFLNLAACYLKSEKFNETIKCCDETIKLDRANPKAYYRKGIALAELNKPVSLKMSIDCLQEAQKLAPNETIISKKLEEVFKSYMSVIHLEEQNVSLSRSELAFKFDTNDMMDIDRESGLRPVTEEDLEEMQKSFLFMKNISKVAK